LPYRNLTALAMEQRAARARFEALLLGAERYLDAGGDLASLSPQHAQQLGLLPQGWFGGAFLGTGDSNPIFHSGSVLGPAAPNGIAVGIEGRRDAHCRRFFLPLPSRQGANFDLDKQHRARRLEYAARSYEALSRLGLLPIPPSQR
jgi:hypothetical protein